MLLIVYVSIYVLVCGYCSMQALQVCGSLREPRLGVVLLRVSGFGLLEDSLEDLVLRGVGHLQIVLVVAGFNVLSVDVLGLAGVLVFPGVLGFPGPGGVRGPGRPAGT